MGGSLGDEDSDLGVGVLGGDGSFGDADIGAHTHGDYECGNEFEAMFSRGTDERSRSGSGGLEYSRSIDVAGNNGGLARSSGHGRNRICNRYVGAVGHAIGVRFVERRLVGRNEGSEYIIDVENEGTHA